MFGIGKILNVIRSVAPFLQFIPALAPFMTLFNIADTVANLVKDFKNGFSFLDLVAKFAPLPKAFSQFGQLGNCFGGSTSQIGSWLDKFSPSSSEFKAIDLFRSAIENRNYVSSVRTNSYYSQVV